MKVLVTGANGFLGRHVVAALSAAGHTVRAVVRPSARIDELGWDAAIEVARADLRSDPNLEDHLVGVEAVVHLAAAMTGSDFTRFRDTVTGTERLFAAMRAAEIDRLVLCSSFAVYDWYAASGTVDEELALLGDGDVYRRGGYASAKLWQERLARRAEVELGWRVTIIRPGFIWGRGNECPGGSIGPTIGPLHVVFSAGRQLPFTHVINTADCFRAVVESEKSGGEILNLIDGYSLTAWRFKGEHLRRAGGRGFRVWLPHWVVWPIVLSIFRVARFVLGPRIKLPFLLMPAGFAQRYRPLRFSMERVSRVLDWQPPLTLDQALDATFTGEGTS